MYQFKAGWYSQCTVQIAFGAEVPLRNYDPLTAHDPSPWLRRVFPDHFGSKQLHVVAFREEGRMEPWPALSVAVNPVNFGVFTGDSQCTFFWEIMLFAMDLRLASCLFSYRRQAMYLTHPRAMRYSMSIQTNCFRMARVIQCWDFCLPRVGVPASAVLSHSVVTGLGLATGEPSLRRWASRQSALPATWKGPTLGHMESAD